MSHSHSMRGVVSQNYAACDASRSVRRRAATAAGPPRLAWLAGCALVAGTLGISTATPVMASCASGDSQQFNMLTSSQCRADAFGVNSTAVGLGAETDGANSTALGTVAKASGRSAIAIGVEANAVGTESTALGFGANARGANATAVGAETGLLSAAVAGATNVGALSGRLGAGICSTAIGAGIDATNNTNAKGNYSIAIGGGDGSVFTPIIGPAINLDGARADGFISIAIGTASQATHGGSSAFGLGSMATANDSAAYGEFSTASGASSIAIGLFSEASAASSLALGRSAIASGSGSVAIGLNSIANVTDTVSIGHAGGERRIMNVAAAVKPTDAVNLAQVRGMLSAAAAPATPMLPQSSGGADAATTKDVDDIRRELTELRTLVKQQQQRIAQLESRNVAADFAK
jgi:trimeric autotransporter adhesin